MEGYLVIHEKDNVAVALKRLGKGSFINYNSEEIVIINDIEVEHKIALSDINEGDYILKYGLPIGRATTLILKGSHVHSHNLKSGYSKMK